MFRGKTLAISKLYTPSTPPATNITIGGGVGHMESVTVYDTKREPFIKTCHPLCGQLQHTIWSIGGPSDHGQLLTGLDVAKHRLFQTMEVLWRVYTAEQGHMRRYLVYTIQYVWCYWVCVGRNLCSFFEHGS